MTAEQARHLIMTDERFVYAKRYNYDIEEMLLRYPESCPDHVIAAALMITEDDVEEVYERIVLKLRELMGVGEDPL